MKFLFCAASLCFTVATLSSGAEFDSDGDGLSDFQEAHKYFTDPKKADSDGDGAADGDWEERREYSYTIRTVIKVMHPCNKEAVNDDYQDARILSETDEYVELEVVHYPFNTNAETIEGCKDWRNRAEEMKPYLKPGITTNWDKAMRDNLVKALAKDGIDVKTLTDEETVKQVSRWLLRHTKYHDMFGTMFVHFPEGQVEIFPGLEKRFKSENSKTPWPVPEHYQHELFGKGMFYTKSHGSCTSTAVLLTTVLRAVGIPTRMVIGIPVVDASDPNQRMMVDEGISHHGVRKSLQKSLDRMGQSFAAHTFNEVFVGGRWRRLNYTSLGNNSYSDSMGLLTHVHTFNDLSEADLAATWGRRYGLGLRDPTFLRSNPYRVTEVSDRFGPYCDVTNTVIEQLTKAPASEAFWANSEMRPACIPKDRYAGGGQGHVLINADVSLADLGDLMDQGLDNLLVLTAEGHPPVYAFARRSIWGMGENDCICYVNISAQEMAKMVDGARYRLSAADPAVRLAWRFEEGVSLVGRPASSVPEAAPKAEPPSGAPPADTQALLQLLSALAAPVGQDEFRTDLIMDGDLQVSMLHRRTAHGFSIHAQRIGQWKQIGSIEREDGAANTYVLAEGKGEGARIDLAVSLPEFDLDAHRTKRKLEYRAAGGAVISLKRGGSVAYVTSSSMEGVVVVVHH